jgi:hypothetical protein
MYETRVSGPKREIRAKTNDPLLRVMQRELDPVGIKIESELRSKGFSETEIKKRKQLIAATY